MPTTNMNEIIIYFKQYPLFVQEILQIFGIFLLSWLIGTLFSLFTKFSLKKKRILREHGISTERRETLFSLLNGIIKVTFFSAAGLLSISLFVDASTLIWMVGLFGAGFGLSARPLISDVMAGASFIFEDTFAVGEKVEILNVEGVIEKITLRTTWLRAPSGEIYTIPNGDIRMLRNFSRGRYSSVKITLRIQTTDLDRTLQILDELGNNALDTFPNLIEPWYVINTTGEMTQVIALELLAKARLGYGAEMRTKLLGIIQSSLSSADIDLEN
jgi:moderate conductance mechanosensitive channel